MFKIGDVVKCVKGTGRRLGTGKTYTIAQINGDGTHITVNGIQYYYNINRFVSADSDKEGERLLTEMSNRLEKQKQELRGICSYVLRMADGGELWNLGDACHARLILPRNSCDVTHVVLNNSLNFDKLSVADQRYYVEYLHYILNESPWANVFLNKSALEVSKKGVLLDVTVGINHLVSAAVAMRIGTEYASRLKMFSFSKKMGFSSHVSWLLSQLCYVGEGNLFTGPIQFNDLNGAHNVIASLRSLEHVLRFLKTGKGVELANNVPFFQSQRVEYKILDYIAPDCRRSESIKGRFEYILGVKQAQWGEQSPKMNNLRDVCRIGEFLENEIKEIV